MSDADPAAGSNRGSLIGHMIRRGIPIIVLLLVVVGVYLFWRDHHGAPGHEVASPPSDPIPVTVVIAQPENVPIRMRFLGQTEGAQVVEIRARVAGYLQPRLFQEGSRVEQGKKLFQIDPRPFEVELSQAQAALRSAEAKREAATAEFKRIEVARSKGVASQQEYDVALAQQKVAAAGVGEAEARVEAAKLQLSYTSIEAPINGVIGRAQKDTGSYVDAGQNGLLAVIQQVDPMYVRYSVTEQEILRFERQVAEKRIIAPPLDQLELEITLSDGSVYPHRGHINFVDVQVDLTTGTAVIRGQVPNPEGRLLPGQFIHASVLGIQRVNVIRVPLEAVQQSPTGASVLVVNDQNVATSRPVVLGEWSGLNFWIIEKGLNPGDRVIASRLMMVRPGVPVSITKSVPSGTPIDQPASTTNGKSATTRGM